MKFGIGQALTRVEDQRFITGAGHYATDARAKGEARAFVLRAPFAHATFRIKNIEAARAMPGVALILTGADLDHLGPLPCQAPQKNRNGERMALPAYPVLPRDTVRHVGEAVAFIVAETSISPVMRRKRSISNGRACRSRRISQPPASPAHPLVHPEAPGNVAFETVLGDMEKTDAVFAKAHRVIGLDLVNNRIVANYMEPRSVLAEVKGDNFTITLGSQGSHGLRDTLAKAIFRIDPANVRVITPDVGGGFGTKTFMYREYPLAAEAARRLGRPVRWVSDRSEHFFACAQGRDNLTHAEMAIDEKGKFPRHARAARRQYGRLSLAIRAVHPVGGLDHADGLLRYSHYTLIRGIYSHSVPIDAYRGAGRPRRPIRWKGWSISSRTRSAWIASPCAS